MSYVNKLLLGLVFIFLAFTSIAAPLTASVNTKNIGVNQVLKLIIEAQSNQSIIQSPDLTPLEKDFTILGAAQTQALNIVNNRITRSDQWIISLIPKHSGKVIIPSISVGSNKTQPITITVSNGSPKNSVSKNTNKNSVFIKTSLKPSNAYVNSELVYQLRVYYDVGMNSVYIIPPSANNATIKQLNQDQGFQESINGKTYQVFQRTYVIFPQKAGKLSISPAIFRAQVLQKSTNPDFATFYGLNARPIELIGRSQTINVKPIPKEYGQTWWLPATQIKLFESWSPDTTHITVGTPITRTITMKGSNVLAAQLPSLNTQSTNDYNSYADQPKTENKIIKGNIVAERQEKFVYIPTQAGTITLPEIKIKWWNTKTNTLQWAVLPQQTFTVTPAAATTSTKTINTPATSTAAPLQKSTLPTKRNQKYSFNDWRILSVVFFILWLGTVIAWWLSRRWKKNFLKNTNDYSLKKACQQNDSVAAKNALMTWTQKTFEKNNIQNLSDVMHEIDCENLINEIKTLQQALYQKTSQTWSGKSLWQALKNYRPNNLKLAKAKNDLPNLNP